MYVDSIEVLDLAQGKIVFVTYCQIFGRCNLEYEHNADM
jgi:hypothetical protein